MPLTELAAKAEQIEEPWVKRVHTDITAVVRGSNLYMALTAMNEAIPSNMSFRGWSPESAQARYRTSISGGRGMGKSHAIFGYIGQPEQLVDVSAVVYRIEFPSDTSTWFVWASSLDHPNYSWTTTDQEIRALLSRVRVSSHGPALRSVTAGDAEPGAGLVALTTIDLNKKVEGVVITGTIAERTEPDVLSSVWELKRRLDLTYEELAKMAQVGASTVKSWRTHPATLPRRRSTIQLLRADALVDAVAQHLGDDDAIRWFRQGSPSTQDLMLSGNIDAAERRVQELIFSETPMRRNRYGGLSPKDELSDLPSVPPRQRPMRRPARAPSKGRLKRQ